MVINVHAGHNPDGKTACGAVGLVKESTEARAVKERVIQKLKAAGHTVYDCTVDNGTSQNDVLKKIVAKCNAHKADLDISIHLNSGRNDYPGDGSIGGTEVYTYSTSGAARSYAEKVLNEIAGLGFKSRGEKTSTSLYVLNHTNAPAMLIELFFVDDKDDVDLYNKVGAEGIANAIVKGITGSEAIPSSAPASSAPAPAAPAEAAVSYDAVITGNNVNIRKDAGKGYPAIGQVNKGQKVHVWKEKNGWCMIDNGKWVSGQYVSKSATTSQSNYVEVWGTVSGTGVNIRSGAGTNYPSVGKVSNGQRVRIWKEENGWCMIDNGKWISGQYVKK